MTHVYRLSFLFIFLISVSSASAQLFFNRVDTIKVTENQVELDNPWAGGLNAPQFSPIDLDFDGVDDMIAFDRTGHRLLTFINVGSNGTAAYQHEPWYQSFFPELNSWVLLRDFNCDGKQDIFTYSSAGIAVYKNTSSNGTISWELVTSLLLSFQPPNDANLYVTSVDLPGIVDLDDDGDLDIITFGILGSYMEYHRNYSVENGFGCDSLIFELRNKCWGYFSENASNNSVNLDDTCGFNVSNPELTGEEEQRVLRHSGSSILALDMDGDVDKEIVLGDVSFRNMVMLTNGGSPSSAYMTAQDTTFPSNSLPVDLPIFPAGFHLDVNNDGKRDLLVAPNTTNFIGNEKGVWFYENTNTDADPTFEFVQNDFLQGGMIEVGEGAYPVFFDHNNDGIQDLLVSNYGYLVNGSYVSQISYYENTGTANAPEFTLITDDYEDLSLVGLDQAVYPTFGDLDGDGDQDMMVGNTDGKLFYFENIAAAGAPADLILSQPNYTDNNGDVIDVGLFATPQLFDIDGDNLLDLLIGERNGNINYYQNDGSATAPSFRFQKDTIGGVVVAEWWALNGYAVPHFFKDNGVTKLLAGTLNGYLHLYDDIDNNVMGTYTQTDSTYANIKPGIRSAPYTTDLNNDGLLDLMVGQYRGGLTLYMGTGQVGIEVDQKPKGELILFPNPTSSTLNLRFSGSTGENVQITVRDIFGKVVRQLNMRDTYNMTINIADMPQGVYFCTLDQSNRSLTSKFVVAR